MWRCWKPLILAWVWMATQTLSQSGDGDWGSGFDIYSPVTTLNDTLQTAGDEPVRETSGHDRKASPTPSPSPTRHPDPRADRCSVHFSTDTAAARRLKAQREELAYLQAVQHGNQAVVENLVQFLGAELGDQSYENVIKENIIGIQEDKKKCHEVVEKAEEDLEKQLEGEVSTARAGMHKIREESWAFEEMLRSAADIANRLETSSRTLQTSFNKQMESIVKIKIHH